LKTRTKLAIAISILIVGLSWPVEALGPTVVVTADQITQIPPTLVRPPVRQPPMHAVEPIVFKHGDISWLEELAIQAGWEPDQIPKLTQIILRESGGCPARRGGDKVDKNCVVTGVSGWSHRSDSGLLQINGVHWKRDHPNYAGAICRKMKICTQEPLLDALTNLRAGRVLFDIAGWAPWDPCYWGPKFAARCNTHTHG